MIYHPSEAFISPLLKTLVPSLLESNQKLYFFLARAEMSCLLQERRKRACSSNCIVVAAMYCMYLVLIPRPHFYSVP